MDIRVCCPSYKRPIVETFDYLPWVKVYVDPKEYDEYIKKNPGKNIVKCADGVQGNISRVRNHILDKEFEDGAEAVLIIDDDFKGLFYWENKKSIPVEPEEFLLFVEKYTLLCLEWGYKIWGVNINQDKQVYREYSPFSTTSFIGAPFTVTLKGSECRYDEEISLKEDYDMTLQQLNKYRGALRVNKFYYKVKQAEQTGGCATYRNLDKEIQQLDALQKKRGDKIVKKDEGKSRSHNSTKVRKFDINPIIQAPIKGI